MAGKTKAKKPASKPVKKPSKPAKPKYVAPAPAQWKTDPELMGLRTAYNATGAAEIHRLQWEMKQSKNLAARLRKALRKVAELAGQGCTVEAVEAAVAALD